MRFVQGYTGRPFEGKYGAYGSDGSSDIESAVATEGRHGPLDESAALQYDSDSDLAPPPEYRGEPIFKSGAVTIQSGGTGAIPREALRNPFPVPMELTEIRIFATVGASVLGAYYSSPLSQLGVSLQLGDEQVSQGFVPANLMCAFANGGMESYGYVDVLNNSNFAGAINIRFSRPLLLRPKELLVCGVAHRGVIAGSITANVGYLGRTRPDLAGKLGKVRILPYFTAWTSPGLVQPATTTTAPVVATSIETDLQNKTQGQVHVDRLVGRVNSVSYQSLQAYLSTELTDGGSGYGTQMPSPASLFAAVYDSHGTPIIAPGTPWRNAFDGNTRALRMDTMLDPGDYYLAQAQLVGEAGGSSALTSYAGIGLVGWREVPLG